MNIEAVELLESVPGLDRAVPAGRTFPAEIGTCRICGWDIFICTTARTPTWLHQGSGRPVCGTDDLRRPWTAPDS